MNRTIIRTRLHRSPRGAETQESLCASPSWLDLPPRAASLRRNVFNRLIEDSCGMGLPFLYNCQRGTLLSLKCPLCFSCEARRLFCEDAGPLRGAALRAPLTELSFSQSAGWHTVMS
ncbi:hypothetical protein SKAU_G00379240 [Synaphobranchus kaupii]|uniref:Uncharacterized protein n=1 Tax=Synaphobranchus kaupii TaxID=118154 RepID=A0A9Q1IEI7_SYNKA|nr:hypothetical protein SKAU_G00379240 [Synaphobranchus kaupii]